MHLVRRRSRRGSEAVSGAVPRPRARLAAADELTQAYEVTGRRSRSAGPTTAMNKLCIERRNLALLVRVQRAEMTVEMPEKHLAMCMRAIAMEWHSPRLQRMTNERNRRCGRKASKHDLHTMTRHHQDPQR